MAFNRATYFPPPFLQERLRLGWNIEVVTAPLVLMKTANEDKADVMHQNVLPHQRRFALVLGTAAFVNPEAISPATGRTRCRRVVGCHDRSQAVMMDWR